MTDLDRLVALAHVVRKAFEHVAMVDDWDLNLAGLCYDASCFLRRVAKEHGIQTELGTGIGHFFVLYGDVVIDITSTQFNQPELVVVLSLPEAEKRGSWWRLQERTYKHPTYKNRQEELAEKEFVRLAGEQSQIEASP